MLDHILLAMGNYLVRQEPAHIFLANNNFLHCVCACIQERISLVIFVDVAFPCPHMVPYLYPCLQSVLEGVLALPPQHPNVGMLQHPMQYYNNCAGPNDPCLKSVRIFRRFMFSPSTL